MASTEQIREALTHGLLASNATFLTVKRSDLAAVLGVSLEAPQDDTADEALAELRARRRALELQLEQQQLAKLEAQLGQQSPTEDPDASHTNESDAGDGATV